MIWRTQLFCLLKNFSDICNSEVYPKPLIYIHLGQKSNLNEIIFASETSNTLTIIFTESWGHRIREQKGRRSLGGICKNGQRQRSCGVILLLKLHCIRFELRNRNKILFQKSAAFFSIERKYILMSVLRKMQHVTLILY